MPDFIRLNPWSVVTWAEQATETLDSRGEVPEPAAILANLENILLTNHKPNRKRLEHGIRRRYWAGALAQLYVLLIAIPLAPAVVFTSGRWWGTTRTYDPYLAYPASAFSGCVGLVVLGVFLHRWRRQRLRDYVATVASCLYIAFTAVGLWFAHDRADSFDGPIGWYVAPLWVLLPLSVATACYQLMSPRNEAWDHLLAEDRTRFDVRRLHPDDQVRMLEERDQAVRILVERGLLTGVDPDELASRPLGRLHLESKESHA